VFFPTDCVSPGQMTKSGIRGAEERDGGVRCFNQMGTDLKESGFVNILLSWLG